MCTCYPIINRVSELKVHIELTRFVQPEKIEIDANERAVNEKSQYCFFVCTTFDSFLNDLMNLPLILDKYAKIVICDPASMVKGALLNMIQKLHEDIDINDMEIGIIKDGQIIDIQ